MFSNIANLTASVPFARMIHEKASWYAGPKPEAPFGEFIHESQPSQVILFVRRYNCGKKVEEDVIDCGIGFFKVFFKLRKAGDGFLSPNTYMTLIILLNKKADKIELLPATPLSNFSPD